MNGRTLLRSGIGSSVAFSPADSQAQGQHAESRPIILGQVSLGFYAITGAGVVGGPYSSGVLAGGRHFEYQQASPEIIAKVGRIKAVAEKYKVPIKAAALQFSLAHPASAAVIPGASKPERIAEDYAALKAVIPRDFWREIRAHGLVTPNAPLPIDRR